MSKSVLFVCLGNICRSPVAEAVFQSKYPEYQCDSAGTSSHHQGELADSRMRDCAAKRGIEITSRSRQFVKEDFERFDLIIGMDDSNLENMRRLDPNEDFEEKLFKLTDFKGHRFQLDHVPDPYYGGEDGFELVIDLVEDCCENLNRYLKK